jgi:threonine dehydratase
MLMLPLEPISLEEIRAAQERIADAIVRTPLVRLNVEGAPAEIYLKLENLQPIGSFKLRGAGNAVLSTAKERLDKGVWTASAGNMAQGVAWYAKRLGLACTVVVPDHAPETKLAAIRRLGSKIVKVTWDKWMEVFITHAYEGMEGLFIHPVSDRAMMAGNGTIALEVLHDLPDVDTIMVPFGGGGLGCGIASAVRAVKPDTKVYACEVETAAPLAASLSMGARQEVQRVPSFVDGIGASVVLEEMWPLASKLLDGSVVVSLASVVSVIKLLAERNRVIAEGAGAASVAAALSGEVVDGKVVCIVSGGNIDTDTLAKILRDEVP